MQNLLFGECQQKVAEHQKRVHGRAVVQARNLSIDGEERVRRMLARLVLPCNTRITTDLFCTLPHNDLIVSRSVCELLDTGDSGDAVLARRSDHRQPKFVALQRLMRGKGGGKGHQIPGLGYISKGRSVLTLNTCHALPIEQVT